MGVPAAAEVIVLKCVVSLAIPKSPSFAVMAVVKKTL